MGDNQVGGGGSVHWNIRVKDPKRAHNGPRSIGHGWQGHDKDGDVGDWFTVSVKVPKGFAPRFEQHPTDPGRLYFNLPIERDRSQIRISWGNSPHHVGAALEARKAGGAPARPRGQRKKR